ncbi:cytochrome P450 [Mycolicibacter longobardus]|uniref:Cytochrome n=1 Tax=Mycolicibacter longobardus TaxID=1108812 RepID=A0A1X1YS02_9MYCO|nr:cytochrome P450 [Mycolicibacter longobardus]MCV7383366.1 cytochrome P450 [Mycolicibacter longobardus]ORW13844.1 cytochrome [Mycolicibacter longobardus]
MSTPIIDEASRVFADPTAYADEPRLHAALTHLRAHAPVSLVDHPPYRPFWAVTRHADILEIERDNVLWINEPRPLLAPAAADDLQQQLLASGMGLRTLIHMDDPLHHKMRTIASDWFRPKAMRAMKARVDELAHRYVDKMAEVGPECDFVQEIAVNYPLYVIMSLLGLPESDFPRMLRLTQELFGGDDDEYRRGITPEEQLPVLLDFFAYFNELTAKRRAHPTDDIASTIANARIDGEPLSDVDTASYYVILATAGHDTTSAAISGGLRALVEHPDQRERLRQDMQLMPTAVEEIIRWVTPVKEFMRTATVDTEVRGVPIAKGESVYLSYVSANRDEDVFADPFVFDVGRDPNKHLAFGHGVHFCVGSALARMEINSFFTALLPRLEDIELAGEPQLVSTTFVGGIKHLPIRYRMRS